MEALHARAALSMRQKDWQAARGIYEAALSLDTAERYRRPLLFRPGQGLRPMGDAEATMAALSRAHADDMSDQVIEGAARLSGTGLLALAESRFALSGPVEWPGEDAPAEAESPVFVVGFPRSGTTLLEQMLGAHEGFVPPMNSRWSSACSMRSANRVSPTRGLADLSRECCASCAIITGRTSGIVELPAGVRLVDKHPLNFLALPLIRRVFPEAPLIFCRRHPCDSILSSYMQNFRDPRLAAECASLERLARSVSSS